MTTCIWTYTGIRFTSQGKRFTWLDESAKQLWFAKFTAQTVGGRYEVEVEENDNHYVVSGVPKYIGMVEDGMRVQYEGADLEARSRIDRGRLERRDSKNGVITGLGDEVARVSSALHTGFERDALVAYLTRRVYERRF